MSNIPFNTIASVLASSGVHRQNAATQTKRTQDQKQSQDSFKVQTDRHAEEVEDLSDTAVESVGEEPDKHNPGNKNKKQQQDEQPAEGPRELVDIAQLSGALPGAVTTAPKAVVSPRTSLDISA